MEQPTASTLARNLRRLRIARRWSLADLASATGTGKATLSAIENARANPTLDTLGRLAEALEVDVTALLEGPPPDDTKVVRAGMDSRPLARLGKGAIESAEFAAESSDERAALPPGARLHVVVTRGKVVAGPAERPTELGPGDYMSFPADRPHAFTTGRKAANAIVIVER
jgi:transcriptional regulator with XRE-family HTH domain